MRIIHVIQVSKSRVYERARTQVCDTATVALIYFYSENLAMVSSFVRASYHSYRIASCLIGMQMPASAYASGARRRRVATFAKCSAQDLLPFVCCLACNSRTYASIMFHLNLATKDLNCESLREREILLARMSTAWVSLRSGSRFAVHRVLPSPRLFPRMSESGDLGKL